jgi:hypothetical protein
LCLTMEEAELLDECLSGMAPADAAILVPRFRNAMQRYRFAPPLLYSIAMLCLQYGYSSLCQYYEDLATSLPHRTHEDLYFRGQAKLRHSDWSGWNDREARLASPHEADIWLPHLRDLQWTTRSWDGSDDLRDKSMLVIADGGFGDCLQMLCYLDRLAHTAASLSVMVRPELELFVHYNFGSAASVTTLGEPCPRVDRYAWMMSLPALLGTIPPFRPLRAPDPVRLPRPDGRRRQIGICWAGHSHFPGNLADGAHSITIGDLAPLFEVNATEWHSLQVGQWASQADQHPQLIRPAVPPSSFAETANLISSLDYVVTVDTAVAHLSGRLSRPTFLLLGWVPPWRWGSNIATTPWYPTMRIIRQPAPRDWAGVTNQLIDALSA